MRPAGQEWGRAMWDMHDIVRLKKNRPKLGLTTATQGIIVQVFAAEPPVYNIEFVEDDGHTPIARLVVEEHHLEWVREGR